MGTREHTGLTAVGAGTRRPDPAPQPEPLPLVAGLPSLEAFVAALSADPARGREAAPGSSGAVAALVAGLVADLAAQVARASPAWAGGEQAMAMAAGIGTRAATVAGDVDRTFQRALEGLDRAAASEGAAATRRGSALGDALVDVLAQLLSIVELAAEAADLAAAVAASCPVALRATVVGATMLATGAAEAAAHLIEINLLMSDHDPVVIRARELVALAHTARGNAAALPR